MSLAPTQTVNFDGGGSIAAGQVVIVSGGIFSTHKIKPGSDVTLDIKFAGLNVTDYNFACEFRDTSTSGAVLIGSDDNTVTFTDNPTGTDTERLRITIPASSTTLLDSKGGPWGLKLQRVSDSLVDEVVVGVFATEGTHVATNTFK